MPVAIPDRGIPTLIIYDKAPEEMEKLTKKEPLPLLPVGNRYLIEHQLEWLGDQGFRNIILSMGDRPQAIEKHIMTGSRWGCEVTHSTDPEYMNIRERLNKHRSHFEEGCLIMDGKSMIHFPFPEKLEITTLFCRNDYLVSLVYCQKEHLDRFLEESEAKSTQGLIDWISDNVDEAALVDVKDNIRDEHDQTTLFIHELTSLDAFLAMNAEIMEHPEVLDFKGSKMKYGVRWGRKTHISSDTRLFGPSLIGDSAYVKGETSIGPGAFIGDRSYIEKGAMVRDSVIAPGTYVGRYTRFEGQYVCRNYVLDMKTKTHIIMDDPLILGDMRRSPAWSKGIEQMLAWILLIPASPLILLLAAIHRLLLGSWVVSEKVLLQPVKRNLKGEYDHEWHYWHRFGFGLFLLDFLPGVYNVAKGQLSFVGNPPITPQELETMDESWIEDRLRGKAGCTGPAQQLEWNAATNDEVYVTTIYYTATRSAKGDILLFLKALTPGVHQFKREPYHGTPHT